jgi:hypothetical protein
VALGHRRILHNGWGVALAEEAFGPLLRRASDGGEVPVRAVAEGHIARELGAVPTLESCLEGVTLQRWMCARAMPPPGEAHTPARWRARREETREEGRNA